MIALVFCGDLKYCPYIKRYIERLEKHSIPYKVYFWNRSGFNLDLDGNYCFFNERASLDSGKLNKIKAFLHFKKWIINVIKEERPSKIIVLSTLTGILMNRLLQKYSTKYIFDIRDYSYEHIPFYYHREKRIIENSAFTAISSKGYKSFLPMHDYVISHNFNRQDIVDGASFRRQEGKIRIVWNGVIRYFEFQKQYIDCLKNDERFEMIYMGDGPELQL